MNESTCHKPRNITSNISPREAKYIVAYLCFPFICIAMYVQLNIETGCRPCVYNPCTLGAGFLKYRRIRSTILPFRSKERTQQWLSISFFFSLSSIVLIQQQQRNKNTCVSQFRQLQCLIREAPNRCIQYKYKLKTRTVTCDGTSNNFSAMQSLGWKLVTSVNSIDHAYKIELTPDPPHMLKNARNATCHLGCFVDQNN